MAFDAKTGKVLWTATEDGASYSSGIGATIAGRRYAVFLTRNGLVGLDPATGQVRFQRPWRATAGRIGECGDAGHQWRLIFVSAEYGPGAGVLRFDGSKLTDVWSSDEALSNHYATSVYSGGYLYGFHGRQEFGQSFRAVDFQTGKVRWSQDRFGAGSVTLAGNRLLIVRENGEMVLAAASPDGFTPIARAQILPATRVRAYPAIADGMLYVRNDDTLVCLDLREVTRSPGSPASWRRVRKRSLRSRGGRFRKRALRGIRRCVRQPGEGRAGPAPYLWQRGIALYYAGRYDDCRRQFESHRAVNPDDVENAAWHFLCVARAESPAKARAALLPVGPDARVPMREIYQMFRGTLTPEQVLSAAGAQPDAQFYGHLYLGLYFEALGMKDRALEHIKIAAADRFERYGGYMHMVARVHLRSLTACARKRSHSGVMLCFDGGPEGPTTPERMAAPESATIHAHRRSGYCFTCHVNTVRGQLVARARSPRQHRPPTLKFGPRTDVAASQEATRTDETRNRSQLVRDADRRRHARTGREPSRDLRCRRRYARGRSQEIGGPGTHVPVVSSEGAVGQRSGQPVQQQQREDDGTQTVCALRRTSAISPVL